MIRIWEQKTFRKQKKIKKKNLTGSTPFADSIVYFSRWISAESFSKLSLFAITATIYLNNIFSCKHYVEESAFHLQFSRAKHYQKNEWLTCSTGQCLWAVTARPAQELFIGSDVNFTVAVCARSADYDNPLILGFHTEIVFNIQVCAVSSYCKRAIWENDLVSRMINVNDGDRGSLCKLTRGRSRDSMWHLCPADGRIA